MWYQHLEWGGWDAGTIIMLVVLMIITGLIVWGIVALAKHTPRVPRTTGEKDALDIAKKRYARGKITKEQFDQIKKDLS